MPTAKKKINKQKELLYLFSIAFTVLVILLTILNLQNIGKKEAVLGAGTENNKEELIKEKDFWEDFLAKNPTYYDGWIRISKIEFLLNENTSAQKSLEISKRIDSNH